jgi:hypothetical protein
MPEKTTQQSVEVAGRIDRRGADPGRPDPEAPGAKAATTFSEIDQFALNAAAEIGIIPGEKAKAAKPTRRPARQNSHPPAVQVVPDLAPEAEEEPEAAPEAEPEAEATPEASIPISEMSAMRAAFEAALQSLARRHSEEMDALRAEIGTSRAREADEAADKKLREELEAAGVPVSLLEAYTQRVSRRAAAEAVGQVIQPLQQATSGRNTLIESGYYPDYVKHEQQFQQWIASDAARQREFSDRLLRDPASAYEAFYARYERHQRTAKAEAARKSAAPADAQARKHASIVTPRREVARGTPESAQTEREKAAFEKALASGRWDEYANMRLDIPSIRKVVGGPPGGEDEEE